MPVYAANLETLWSELPVGERPAAAARAGFEWVEIPRPYDVDAAGLRRDLLRHGLRLVLLACPPPNYTGGARGFAATPGGEGRFQRDFARVLRYAELLEPRVIQILPGEAGGVDARSALVRNLGWAAERAGGRRMVIEPREGQALPGGFEETAAILDEVGAPNLSLLFDADFAHALSGDALATWAQHGPRAGHVRFADAPGRGVPSVGDLDLPSFLAAVDAAGHEGPLGSGHRPGGIAEPTPIRTDPAD